MNNRATVRALVDLRDRTLQKNRIAFGLRVGAIERGDDIGTKETTGIFSKYQERFSDMEKDVEDDIKELIKDDAIIQLMVNVKGVGIMLAAKIVSMIDIDVCEDISSLWRFCGYAVIDGKAEKPTKGEKLHYNSRLKSTLYVLAGSFLKSNSPYRVIYDSAKLYYQENRLDWTKLHIHYAAIRKMMKTYLSHLWLVWRNLEGLPITDPYVIDKLNHKNISTPKEFGWYE